MPKKNEAISSEAHKHYSIRNPKQPIRQKRDPNHRNFANTEREKKKKKRIRSVTFSRDRAEVWRRRIARGGPSRRRGIGSE